VPQYIAIQNCNNTYSIVDSDNMYRGQFPHYKNYCVRKKFKFSEFYCQYYIKLLYIMLNIMYNNAMGEYLWVQMSYAT